MEGSGSKVPGPGFTHTKLSLAMDGTIQTPFLSFFNSPFTRRCYQPQIPH